MVTPTADASATFPGRMRYIHKPVSSAAGTVTTIVNIPHALSASALTTTLPTLASVATTMKSVAMEVVTPDSSLMLLRASFASDSPSCRTEASRITKSWTAPPRHAPITIQM